MKWSKLKKLVEDRFAPSLQGRVAIFSTQYGNCHCGRAWLTVDGEEVANFCTRAKHQGLLDRVDPPLGYGEISRQDAYAACWAFVHDLSIDESLADSDPLVQTLAVLDSRVGKRRLKTIDPVPLHPLAQKFLSLRLEGEGVS